MQFLPEDKKKAIVAVAVLLLVVGATIYVYSRATCSPVPAAVTAPAGNPSAPATGGLLPYGSLINTDVLQQDKFKALRAGPAVGVTPDQLGKPDLFAK